MYFLDASTASTMDIQDPETTIPTTNPDSDKSITIYFKRLVLILQFVITVLYECILNHGVDI